MEYAITFNNVWKKFKKGEKFNSLRDTIPNLVRSVLHQKKDGTKLEDREFWAVNGVSFQVADGEVVGIIGPNGAGKSTILKLLSRIMDPTKGELEIRGRLSALIEVTAGFHPELTGRENVYLNGTILGMKRKEIDERFDDIVDFSGLAEFIDTPVKRYSSGMYSRLGFSVAAHVNPKVLLVDEVLAVGDIAFQSKCAQKMRELLKSGVTIVLVSHNLSLIQSLCHRVILLDRGQVIKEGATKDVVPYYENLVLKQKEEELKKRAGRDDFKVAVKQDTGVEITGVKITNENGETRESFSSQDALKVEVEYEAQTPVSSPVFSLEIARADGVVCCASNTKDNDIETKELSGKGKITIDLGRLLLAPGIYMPKLSVWDKDMIHTYVVREEDVLRVEAQKLVHHAEAVYYPAIKWEV